MTSSSKRALDWEVRVGDEVFKPSNPGALKQDIVLEYNSVGACIAGQLTFEGYKDWKPYSRLVQVFVGAKRIGLGIVGMVESTISANGKRTTTVPIVGLDAIDRDGLAVLGLGSAIPEVGVAEGVQLVGIGSPLARVPTEVKKQDALGIVQTTIELRPPPYGETVNAGFQRMFNGDGLMSWGVRPDGVRVAGLGSGGENYRAGANVRVQPSNWELNDYVSEYVERPAERWQQTTYTRPVGLMPRRGAALASDDILGDHKADAPLEKLLYSFQDNLNVDGSFVAVLDLYPLVRDSLSNPNAEGVTYQPTGVVVEIEITFDHAALPDSYPVGWDGSNYYKLGTWQDSATNFLVNQYRNRIAQGNQPMPGWDELQDFVKSSYFPQDLLTTTQAEDKTVTAKDKGYWLNLAVRFDHNALEGMTAAQTADLNSLKQEFQNKFPGLFADKLDAILKAAWVDYLTQISVNVQFGEWLTTSNATAAMGAVYQVKPVLNATKPVFVPPFPNPISALQGWANALSEYEFNADPKAQRAANAQWGLDPKKDPGLLKPFYVNSVYLNTGERRTLTWRFAVPKELLAQLDPTLGTNYKWAIGAVFSGIRLGLKARGKITGARLLTKRALGKINTQKNLPGYTKAVLATPTYQGVILGEIPDMPFQVQWQQMTNAKVYIRANGIRTEFQTGAPSGGN